MICDLAEVQLDTAKAPERGTRDEQERINIAEQILDVWVRIYDGQVDTTEISTRARRHKIEYGQEPILNITDHVGITRRAGKSDWSELEAMGYAFTAMAQASLDPHLAFSQVPEGMEQEAINNNKIVYNKDLRGSKGLRNAADYLVFGWKHSCKVPQGRGQQVYNPAYRHHTAIQVVKNRETGREFWGVFKYVPEYYRLTNYRDEGTEDDIFAVY